MRSFFSAAYLPLLAPWHGQRSQARQVKSLEKEVYSEGWPPPSLPRSAGEELLQASPGLAKALEWLLSKKLTLVKGLLPCRAREAVWGDLL